MNRVCDFWENSKGHKFSLTQKLVPDDMPFGFSVLEKTGMITYVDIQKVLKKLPCSAQFKKYFEAVYLQEVPLTSRYYVQPSDISVALPIIFKNFLKEQSLEPEDVVATEYMKVQSVWKEITTEIENFCNKNCFNMNLSNEIH